MALKRKIDTTTYNTLTDVLKAEYKAEGNGYVLDTDDATELIAARDREKANHKTEKERADKLQAAVDAAAAEAAKGNPDKEKIITLEAEVARLKPLAENLPKREAYINELLGNTEARAIATRVFGENNADAMLHHVTSRLHVDLTGDKPKVVINDKDGKPTTLAAADLEKDLKADTRFSGIVVASKASGAAVPPGPQRGSATLPNTDPNAPKSPRDMSGPEYIAHMQSKNPDLVVPGAA